MIGQSGTWSIKSILRKSQTLMCNNKTRTLEYYWIHKKFYSTTTIIVVKTSTKNCSLKLANPLCSLIPDKCIDKKQIHNSTHLFRMCIEIFYLVIVRIKTQHLNPYYLRIIWRVRTLDTDTILWRKFFTPFLLAG